MTFMEMFILKCLFHSVAVVISKAPSCVLFITLVDGGLASSVGQKQGEIGPVKGRNKLMLTPRIHILNFACHMHLMLPP